MTRAAALASLLAWAGCMSGNDPTSVEAPPIVPEPLPAARPEPEAPRTSFDGWSRGCRSDTECATLGAPVVHCPSGEVVDPLGQCVAGACVMTIDPCPRGEPQCARDDDCPGLGSPCSACADGTSACWRARCNTNRCVPVAPTCAVMQPSLAIPPGFEPGLLT